MLEASASQPQLTQDEPPENDTKENDLVKQNKSEVNDENESTPSPTQNSRRRTSTGKIDRRMVGKMCTRRWVHKIYKIWDNFPLF